MASRQAPRPKRGGEEFARAHYNDEEGSSSKKVRFDTRNPAALAADAPEDDAVLDADVIGRRGAKAKRSAVNIDGFESDSSNEGFDARANAKARQSKDGPTKSKMEEDDDMFADVEEKEFADGDDDEDLRREGKRRKEVKLANLDDIDGQEMNSKSRGHISAKILQESREEGHDQESESESSSDEDDEERRAALDEGMDEELGAGGKKKHAPRLEAFNLNEEREDGAIDEHHNYVRKATDPDAVYDNWLEGTNKRDMRIAKEAHERRERERVAKDREDDEVLYSDILLNLIPHLDLGETVMEALARLGRGSKNKSTKIPSWRAKRKNRKALDMNVDDTTKESIPENEAEKRRRQVVEAITDAADRLMKKGHEDVYDYEREVLTRLYKRETGEDWVDRPSDVAAGEDQNDGRDTTQWLYRWADSRDGGEVHGPYDGSAMAAWNDAGYFGEGVEFRPAGDEAGFWRRSVQFI